MKHNRGILLLTVAILEAKIPKLDPIPPTQLAKTGKLEKGAFTEDEDVRLAKAVIMGLRQLIERYWPSEV